MNKTEKVSQIMTASVISIDKNTNDLRDAKMIFRKEGIRHLDRKSVV
jgi:signal-transduction protein with cAMP-binding, CBS, and nucleotidyltransferase domain